MLKKRFSPERHVGFFFYQPLKKLCLQSSYQKNFFIFAPCMQNRIDWNYKEVQSNTKFLKTYELEKPKSFNHGVKWKCATSKQFVSQIFYSFIPCPRRLACLKNRKKNSKSQEVSQHSMSSVFKTTKWLHPIKILVILLVTTEWFWKGQKWFCSLHRTQDMPAEKEKNENSIVLAVFSFSSSRQNQISLSLFQHSFN